jgi:2,3-bisphosphoglycerate-independent phosphoglycerate mutase
MLTGAMIITADHGNCETMIDQETGPHTAHTLKPVPVVMAKAPGASLAQGRLADLAPTLLPCPAWGCRNPPK